VKSAVVGKETNLATAFDKRGSVMFY
jgi:hypothetical protein